jgi:SAM-dependent methyltransferase
VDSKLDAPATHRNREPIAAVLRQWLPQTGTVLEVASGTGQHSTYFAEQFPHLVWQPSELDPKGLASIRAWAAESQLANLRPPLQLDVCQSTWPIDRCDVLLSANLIHIAPWPVALGLLSGANRILSPDGTLCLYGPFRIGGQHTAPSNEAFDQDLRRRDPSWGVRDLERVVECAREEGFELIDRVEMPANNQTLVFRRIRN